MFKWALIAMLSSTLVSTNAVAHQHWPQVIEKDVTSSVVEVKFELTNYFDKFTCFDVEINGEIFYPYRTCLQPKQSKEITSWVYSVPDEHTLNEVCSISVSTNGMETKSCTILTTFYPKSELSLL